MMNLLHCSGCRSENTKDHGSHTENGKLQTILDSWGIITWPVRGRGARMGRKWNSAPARHSTCHRDTMPGLSATSAVCSSMSRVLENTRNPLRETVGPWFCPPGHSCSVMCASHKLPHYVPFSGSWAQEPMPYSMNNATNSNCHPINGTDSR